MSDYDKMFMAFILIGMLLIMCSSALKIKSIEEQITLCNCTSIEKW